MKRAPALIALVESLGLTAYVAVFALLVRGAQSWLRPGAIHPVTATILFLLVFVVSALICGSIVLGYPLLLFFEGKKKLAVEIVILTIAWLIAIAAVFLGIAASTGVVSYP